MLLGFETIKEKFHEILLRYGFHENQAAELAKVFAETTIDGVFSHGINRFPRFIDDVKNGTVHPGTVPELKGGFHAFEQWDGRKGAGISNALFCTDRCMELASGFGIGCVGLRNTNHWMRGGSYGWQSAERGFLFLGWTNTLPNMPPWGGSKATLGNNPLVLAIPHKKGHVVLDMAMSQYSYGKLEWHKKTGTDLPEFGGYDLNDRLTKDPGKILESKRILPAGLWKGSALSLVLDLAAAILSGGNTTREIGELASETDLSQVFIAIDIQRHMSDEERDKLITETLKFTGSLHEGTRYPGQRTLSDRKKHLEEGVEIPGKLWEEINGL
jgi:3-dehydro-L-gulonate 2-dehydrogenase